MSSFIGIFNSGGRERKLRMYIDFKENESYITDLYINNIRLDAKIDGSKCTIYEKKQFNSVKSLLNYICGYEDKTTYEMNIEHYNDEIIITGSEENKNCMLCIPRFSRPKFFVVTNKEEV